MLESRGIEKNQGGFQCLVLLVYYIKYICFQMGENYIYMFHVIYMFNIYVIGTNRCCSGGHDGYGQCGPHSPTRIIEGLSKRKLLL